MLAREHIPVVGHVGLVPSRATWTGGFRAVGKTADAALALCDEVRAYEDAGAFAVEIEVVPVEVATAISRRVDILLLVDGRRGGLRRAVPVCRGHSGREPRATCRAIPRSTATSPPSIDRLQAERIAAFREFVADVAAAPIPKSATSCG